MVLIVSSLILREELDVERGRTPELMAWCQVSNLIAVLTHSSSGSISVSILHPDSPKDKWNFEIYLENPSDRVISLEWSPSGTRTTLLAISKNGSCYMWTQKKLTFDPENKDPSPYFINNWYSNKIVSCSEEVICGKWLSSPSCYNWPPHTVDSMSRDCIEGSHKRKTISSKSIGDMFFYPSTVEEEQFSCIRPGTHCFVIITKTSKIKIFKEELTSSKSKWNIIIDFNLKDLSPPSPLSLCDVLVVKGKIIKFAVSSEEDHSKINILDFRANFRSQKSLIYQSTNVLKIASDHNVISFKMVLVSGNIYILTLEADYQGLVILKKYDFVDSIFLEIAEYNLGRYGGDSKFSVSPDTSTVSIISHGRSVLILDLADLYKMHSIGNVAEKEEKIYCCQFGPSGISLALCSKSNTAFNLEIWCLLKGFLGRSKNITNKEIAVMLANRIALGFVCGSSVWDVTKSLELCSSIGVVYDTLSNLDQKIHENNHHSRSLYSDLLDKAKMTILSHLPDNFSTKAVLVDICFRLKINFLHKLLNLSFFTNMSGILQRDPRVQESLENEELKVLLPYITYFEKLMSFALNCLFTWIRRNEEFMDKKDSDHYSSVPFIRLLVDHQFVKQLLTTLGFLNCVLRQKSEEDAEETELKKLKERLGVYNNVLHSIISWIRRSMSWSNNNHTKESKCIQYIMLAMPGKVHLHYARADGSINWMHFCKFKKLLSNSKLDRIMSDSEIDEIITALTLLPFPKKLYQKNHKIEFGSVASPSTFSNMAEEGRDSKNFGNTITPLSNKPGELGISCDKIESLDVISYDKIDILQSKACAVDESFFSNLSANHNEREEASKVFNKIIQDSFSTLTPVSGSRWKKINRK